MSAGWDAVTHKDAKAGTWVICNHEAKEVAQSDDSTIGYASLVKEFEARLDQVVFAAFLVHGVDEKESVTSTRPKLIKINWVGPKIKPMMRMKALSGKAAISRAWQGFALEIDGAAIDDVDEHKDVMDALLGSGGAHKPTDYDFGDAKFPVNFHDNKATD